LRRGKQQVHGKPASLILRNSRWGRYAEAAVRVEDGALRVGVRFASIRGSLVADKIIPRGAGVLLSGARQSGTSLNGILILEDASLHGVSLGGTFGLADTCQL